MPAPNRVAVSPEMIEPGSGTAADEIVTVPEALLNGTDETSLLFESSTSKYVDAPPLLEPVPSLRSRLTLNESPSCGSSCVSVVIGKMASRYVWPAPIDTVLPSAVESVAVNVSLL